MFFQRELGERSAELSMRAFFAPRSSICIPWNFAMRG